ncbi:PhoH family protein [Tenuifilum thalassicum]|uniref:PhoH-like protein n=1 Tax=Tenuifilum thalassicum TaxID=2590900 RepID=A0A7D3XMT0_9BACT|nr:PhoH family protein [Tenuifilum thalassicum]QKG80416.1 PhoH family protein [Tenuifilum thalassicum]
MLMTGERIIIIEGIDPLVLYGVNNTRFEIITKHYPKLKIVGRGDIIKVIGDEDLIEDLDRKLHTMVQFYIKYGYLGETNIKDILQDNPDSINKAEEDISDVLVYGNHGKLIKARTVNQRQLVELYDKNDLIFAIGPAGSGKTYTAIALAVRALKNKEVKRIILTRPAVEAGERLGFLPGDMKEKLDPYLQPLYDALNDMIPARKLQEYMEDGTVQIAPLAYMRGRTLDNAFVILDEAQNTTLSQLKMFLTRMGNNAKFIVTGDITQIDLPNKNDSGLLKAIKLLDGINDIAIIYFDTRDIIRHKLVKYIVNAFEGIDKKDEDDDKKNHSNLNNK